MESGFSMQQYKSGLQKLLAESVDNFFSIFSKKLNFKYELDVDDQMVAFRGFYNDSPFHMFRFGVLTEYKQIQISTAFLPQELHGNKIILFAIAILHDLGRQQGYETFAIDLVDGFRRKLLSLGAYETDEYDTLQINELVTSNITSLFLEVNPEFNRK